MTAPEEWELTRFTDEIPDRDFQSELDDRGVETPEDLGEWDNDWAQAVGDDWTDLEAASVGNLWNDTGHYGELWLEDGDWIRWPSNHRTRKPIPRDKPLYCECGWPIPFRWTWKQCEFGGDWELCQCNGCVGVSLQQGRPPERCTKCQRDLDNSKRRDRYKNVTKIEGEIGVREDVFVP